MIEFLVSDFFSALQDITKEADGAFIAKEERGADGKANDEERNCLMVFLERIEHYCNEIHLIEVRGRIGPFKRRLKENADCFYQVIDSELASLLVAIRNELAQRKFIFIPPDSVKYLEQEALFGKAVYDAFPSARDEIKAAGNCLAADLNTAAVFHLMRTVELGLRAFARHLPVKVKKKPLEYSEWGPIIKEIEKKIEPKIPKKRGPKQTEAYEFYHGIMGEFNAFKDVWRNSVMHTRRSYNASEAVGVFQHVRNFMQRLSTRISEIK
ncbi:MAG TPA: hypothetical protein VN281_05390 [Verrucomicrobiae bacterium]|jgi:hypothetical protein|nr:hypothetical protein [Verrucomicrobiae bacterium]